MRIDDATVSALLTGKSFKQGNTRVRCYTDEFSDEYVSAQVFLHDNEIAHYYLSARNGWMLTVMDAGYRTLTTKTRLNAIADGVTQGPTIRIDGGVTNINSKDGFVPEWTFRYGDERRTWIGEANFFAKAPTTK